VKKKKITELAILGGDPAFFDLLHVGRPNIGNRARLLEYFNDILDRRWFTNNGVLVQELEQRLADFLGVKHCVSTCNGTIALELAIRAADMHGEVIVPSFTFIATAHALQWQQITPVFCDINPNNHHLDPNRIEGMITPRTTGIVGVHVWGVPCDISALTDIAQRHNLRLVFDAAHAFACSYKGQIIGSFGDAEIFSFHATKFFNSFEGGAVTTNSDDLAQKLRFMRNFGFAGIDDVQYIGTNGKMTEISAAMALTSLESLDEFVEVNYQNYQAYRQGLGGIPGIKMFNYDETEKCNYQYIIVEIDEAIIHITRDQLVNILHAENVLARRYFYPGCHQMEPYRSYFPNAGLLLPETEKLTQRVMSLPTGTAVHPEEISQICEIIRVVVDHGEEIRQRLCEYSVTTGVDV